MTRYAVNVMLAFFLAISQAFGMGCGGECASCHTLTQQEAARLLKDVGTVKSVTMAPVRGLYELTLEHDGRQGVAYLDFGKKHLMPGPIFTLGPNEPSATAPQKAVHVEPGKIPLENSLVMGNPKGTKKLFVFTDPECPFCARLHGELKKLVAMDADLAVYIKLFPLKIHPDAYEKARVIVGAHSLEMLDKSYAGGSLPKPGRKDGKKPVDDTIRFAESLGIDVTPTLVLPDGSVVVGTRDAETLKALLAGAVK